MGVVCKSSRFKNGSNILAPVPPELEEGRYLDDEAVKEENMKSGGNWKSTFLKAELLD